jgi:four helix bundle protein
MEKPHKKLDAWVVGMTVVTEVYRLTAGFPRSEAFGLTAQMRRAAMSVPSNLAEGAARRSRKEFGRFLRMAQASLSEVDTQVEVARRLGYVSQGKDREIEELMRRVDKMLSGLIRRQARDD